MSELADRRRQLRWSQDQLAAESGVSSRTVWSAEHGRHVGARSLAAIELALAQAEKRAAGRWTADALDPEISRGKVLIELSTPDGSLRLTVTVDPGMRVDVEQLRRDLLDMQQRLGTSVTHVG